VGVGRKALDERGVGRKALDERGVGRKALDERGVVEMPLVREEHARLRTRRRLPSGIQVSERGAISGIVATNIRTCLSLAKPETSRPVPRLEEGKEWRMQAFSRAPPVAVIRTVV
jgi:hypothetical protein